MVSRPIQKALIYRSILEIERSNTAIWHVGQHRQEHSFTVLAAAVYVVAEGLCCDQIKYNRHTDIRTLLLVSQTPESKHLVEQSG